MAQKKPNWPLMYFLSTTLDAMQAIGDFIPGVDFIVIPANLVIDVAVGGALAWWAKRIGALDLSSGAAIGASFLLEQLTGGALPLWVADIGVLHVKYKANQIKIGNAILSGPPNQNGRREPTAKIQPFNQGGSRRPM